MKRSDVQPLREILHGAAKRYLSVRPNGFELNTNEPLRPYIEARIINVGAARTLYQQRKPACRSLDAVHPIGEPQRACAQCRLRAQCTPQIRLDIFIDARPFRMLLAHTSAKNFLVYEAILRQRNVVIEERMHRITVTNRGTWGELRFNTLD